MDVNLAITPRPAATSQPSISPARSSTRPPPAPDHGPTLQLNTAQAAGLREGEGRTGSVEVVSANIEDLKKAETLKALISDEKTQLRTYHDEASGRSVLEVRDQTTGDVVIKYPSDELLRLYAALREPFVDQNA